MLSIVNINIGILGHVDCGKTSLAKCLSTISSTAAFDKNPQSQERGITLDLGFSSFSMNMPDHLKTETNKEVLQYTLVDCPGHASLIRTIIGAAHIIDMIMLVIDVTKGIQTQTAECIIIAEIICKKLVVVLNKIDLIEKAKRTSIVEKVKGKILNVLSKTTLVGETEIPVIGTCALWEADKLIGVAELISVIANISVIPNRVENGPFQFAVDHCFAIKGQGTVITGTVLQGGIKVNDTIDVPTLGITRKVKSLQMFRKPVLKAHSGDRLGICVTQFEPKLFERGIVCSPGAGSYIKFAILKANFIKHFKQLVLSKSKFHISIGYDTVLAQIILFKHVHGICDKWNIANEYEFIDGIDPQIVDDKLYYILLDLENSIYSINDSLVIASKLDMDISKNSCRLAFWGKLQHSTKEDGFLQNVKIYKYKQKTGVIDRVIDNCNIVVKNMFKKETVLDKFINLNVILQNGEIGKIESGFGQNGKVKVNVPQGLDSSTLKNSDVTLRFKKYLFHRNNKLSQ